MKQNLNRSPSDDALEALARCLYPSMVAYFESAEGRREFAEWQARQDTENSPGSKAAPGKTSGRVA